FSYCSIAVLLSDFALSEPIGLSMGTKIWYPPLIGCVTHGAEIVFMRIQLLCLMLAIGACSPSAMADPASTPPLSSPKDAPHVEAGTPASSPAGTTFTVPSGWTMTTKGPVVVLSPPEPDLSFALIDIETKDAVAAV